MAASSSATTRKRKRDAETVLEVVDARLLSNRLARASVDLVVTSPPYPMIAMWDTVFSKMSVLPPSDWSSSNVMSVFEAMHTELDKVWTSLKVVTKEGAIVAINIGDATRSVDGRFTLFPNGARITMGMIRAGFTPLPNIYWKKPSNKPNAFLGSGFYPVNAYVTVDCEHILLFRHGEKRSFPAKDPSRESSKFTKDERNAWFTQIWEINGAKQEEVSGRRTAAFPLGIATRLVRMFSVCGDTVFDPFVGTGTTVLAARELGRRGIGFDIDEAFIAYAKDRVMYAPVEKIRAVFNSPSRTLHSVLETMYSKDYTWISKKSDTV